jgi:hypothetical protein
MQVSQLRVVHSNAGVFSANSGLGTQLNREINLTFDTAGKLVSGTVRKTRDFAFPVPLPPGAGGVTVPYVRHALDLTDGALVGVAEQMHHLAVAGGGITEVATQDGSRMVSGIRAGQSFLEHLPGAPLLNDAASMGHSSWGKLIPAGNASVDLARLGAALRRLA